MMEEFLNILPVSCTIQNALKFVVTDGFWSWLCGPSDLMKFSREEDWFKSVETKDMVSFNLSP